MLANKRLKFWSILGSLAFLKFIIGLSFFFLPSTLGQVSTPLPSKTDSGFSRLQQVLEQYGFTIRLERPPIRGNYGMLETRSKSIWINPVVFELGIARQTLVHESVHGAQLCKGGAKLELLGLEILPPVFARPYFLRYSSPRREMEIEAYALQAQPDGVEQAISLLHRYCR